MNEELLQRNLINNPEKIGRWDFCNIGSTTLNALKNAGIIPKKDYKSFERRKPDGIITSKKEVVAVVENKSVSKFKTKKQKQDALKQGLDVAQVLNAKILILTDSVDTIWINALNGEEILDEKGRILKVNFDYKNQDLEKLIQQIIDSIDKDNSQIREPRLKDPTRLAKSVWQDLWMAAGATPENCLYSFVELFIFKYLSDLGVLKEHLSYDFIMKMFAKQNEQEVLEYYADNVRKHIKEKLFPIATEDRTTIINGTIFVSKDEKAVEGYGTTFHKILKKFGDEKEGGGELRNIDKDFKSKLFETFLKESISKKNWGQYFTPLKVVRAIVKMAESEIKEGITICDPACGVGKFLLEPLLINNNIEHFYEVKNSKLIPKIKLVGIDKGFDHEEQKTIILAKANMLIYMSDMIRKYPDLTPEFSKLFNDSFELKTKNILGTLRDTSYEGKLDLILTNPPYVTTGSSNLKDEIVKCGLESRYKINAMGVEGLFMEWIIRALRPGGKAFIVVPNGIFNRGSDEILRQYIQEECFVEGVISLPKKTFFTTPQKTYILCITKKNNKSEEQITPIFSYIVSEIGEKRDVNRFDIEKDDLSAAVELYNGFKGSKNYFAKNNTDIRCKLIPFNEFTNAKKWAIENWWSKEELVLLGLSEEERVIKIKEYPPLLSELSENIETIKDEIINISEIKENNFIKKKIKEIFDLDIKTNHSKFTKTFINLHKGNIPVYSASKFPENVDYGYVQDNLPNVKYFENCLTWNIDGSVGKVHYRQGRFSLSEKVIPLILKKEYESGLDIDFLKYTIENEFAKYAFGFDNKAGKGKIQEIEIEIPIKQDGKLNLDLQIEISKRYKFVDKMKEDLKNQMNNLLNIQIEI